MSKNRTQDEYDQFVKSKDTKDKGTLIDLEKSITNHSEKLA